MSPKQLLPSMITFDGQYTQEKIRNTMTTTEKTTTEIKRNYEFYYAGYATTRMPTDTMYLIIPRKFAKKKYDQTPVTLTQLFCLLNNPEMTSAGSLRLESINNGPILGLERCSSESLTILQYMAIS
eukprot:scaffold2813_cov114-Cylindrotheca_fusiformis.AAC.2